MRPDKTLIQLVTWINVVEAENEQLVAVVRQFQEKDKKSEAMIKQLRTEADKVTAEKAKTESKPRQKKASPQEK